MTPEELTAMREAAGLNRTQLAAAIGKSQRTVERYEAGDSEPDETTQIAILSVLGERGSARAPRAARKSEEK